MVIHGRHTLSYKLAAVAAGHPVQIKKQGEKPRSGTLDTSSRHLPSAPLPLLGAQLYKVRKDVCVIKLNEKKFSLNFSGNVLRCMLICLAKGI